ncbi:hypothetical protein Epa17_00161 [Pseudomonas phage Epa17]|uniref:Uncharacterized protein n=4 Tax=Nankokuvirus G1 TaxID=2560662 RepID=A0A6G9LEV9_9CAUD|nr:hypothetical protein Epa24_00159 [Pseudomonas phage Epa24]QIQ64140.1 hypothetical protein Epa17_00161 [Pseudomonas phage Epa17]QIQ65031.1 hypothetical protein 16_00080 [Pseudomonas phage Epa16]QIQ65665.1 hypothetical protein 26_00012 [Pseudomonas phage Epa26]
MIADLTYAQRVADLKWAWDRTDKGLQEVLREFVAWYKAGCRNSDRFTRYWRICTNVNNHWDSGPYDDFEMGNLFIAAGYHYISFPFEQGERLDTSDNIYDNPHRREFLNLLHEVIQQEAQNGAV